MTPPCHGWDSPGSHHVVPKMRISLSQKYIQNVLGENTLDTFLNVYNANAAIVSYISPWIATFTVITNMLGYIGKQKDRAINQPLFSLDF